MTRSIRSCPPTVRLDSLEKVAAPFDFRMSLPYLLTITALIFLWIVPAAAATTNGTPPAGLSGAEWASISGRIRVAEYQATWRTRTGIDGVREAWDAPNRANDLRFLFADDGLYVVPRREREPSWRWHMSLVGVGREGDVGRVAAPELVARKNRIEYRRGPLVEWYVNRQQGLEQGFTLHHPPAEGDGRVTLELLLDGDLVPAVTDAGRSLILRNRDGVVLGYRNLTAFDATGRRLMARLDLAEPTRLLIVVDDADATYPLTIDPLISSEVAKLTAADGAVQDSFGISVSISGDVVVVGAQGDDDVGNGSGSAYVIERNQGGADGWGEVTKITAADGTVFDYFGSAVAVDGDTVAVGARFDDDNGPNSGSVYVFTRNQGGADAWGQVAKLNASDGADLDEFGQALAISGDTLVVGAWYDDVGANADQGSAYVYSRNHGGADAWGEVAKLVGSDSAAGDKFSRKAVAISGDIVVIGAMSHAVADGGAYIFARNQGGADTWGEVKKLTPSVASSQALFGSSVGVSGSTILVAAQSDDALGGASGSAFVFEQNEGGADNWGEVKKLTASDGEANDLFGESCAIDGGTVVVGARAEDGVGVDSGAAYVFERNRGGADNWGEVQKLTASDSAAGDFFSFALDISGDTIVAGAPSDEGATGSAYVFVECGTEAGEWQEVSKTTASDAWSSDLFGAAVALSGEYMIVGAPMADAPWNSCGAAYVLQRNLGGADGWGEVVKLTASDAAGGERFGTAVAISDDTAVVGAFLADDDGDSSGSAYVFSRNWGGQDNWGQVTKLTASDAAASDRFGESLAMSNGTAIIGAPFESSQGAAYVFERNQGGADNWGEVAKLAASDPGSADTFAKTVAIDGDTALVGSPQDNDAGNDSGSAYLFERNQGGADSWGQVLKLTAADAAGGDRFGFSVSISQDILVVGAYQDDDSGSNSGSAYVLERNQGGADNWGQVQKLTPADGAATDYFGYSVSISNDIVAVDALLADGAGADSGAVYVFERNQGGADNWGELEKLIAVDTAAGDLFGIVALDGHTLAIGVQNNDDNGSNSGSAYIFNLSCLVAYDLGDAPDPSYPTLLASDGARHVLGGGLYLGASVDAEDDGQPSADATGDDNDAEGDDEDGVVFTSMLVPGGTAGVDVEASGPCLLNAWVDFNSDGDWEDTDERIFTDESLAAGVNPLVFTVPATASPGSTTFARFRVDSGGGLPFAGEAGDGEVEDHLLYIEELDFGDAQDPTYPTLLASDGARHILGYGLFLGAAVDGDADGQPTTAADGDDNDGLDDEDGVVFTSGLGIDLDASLDVSASAAGLLNAWVDFNSDGDWLDAGEQVFTDLPLTAGVNPLSFAIPGDATLGMTFARFRLASTGGLAPAGLNLDGEVEDYQVEIMIGADVEVAISDDPDPVASGRELSYTATITNNGPLDATSVTFTDTLPAEVIFVSSTPGSPDCGFSAGTLTCDLGTLAPSADTQVIIDVVLDHPVQGTLGNTATVTATENDPIAANNTANETTTIGLFIDGFESGDTGAWSSTVQ